jgi:hypothetical protein
MVINPAANPAAPIGSAKLSHRWLKKQLPERFFSLALHNSLIFNKIFDRKFCSLPFGG